MKETYEMKFHFCSSHPDPTPGPFGIAISPSGEIFVSNSRSATAVYVFQKNGDFIRSFGTLGSKDGELVQPAGCIFNMDGYFVVVDKGTPILLRLTDTMLVGNDRVQSFNQKGEFISKFGSSYLRSPYFVAEDHDGNYLVPSYTSSTIAVFSPDGIFLQMLDGNFSGPVGVVVGPNGDILITSGMFRLLHIPHSHEVPNCPFLLTSPLVVCS